MKKAIETDPLKFLSASEVVIAENMARKGIRASVIDRTILKKSGSVRKYAAARADWLFDTLEANAKSFYKAGDK